MGARKLKAVLDTNIIIDLLNGIEPARVELARYKDPSISLITWIEVLAGTPADVEPQVRQLLDSFHLQSVSKEISERALGLRRERRIRVPDAIIWATALELGQILITRNTRDFPADHPGIRIPYRL